VGDPGFDEAGRLGESLAATADYLAETPWSTRIVVVDNGSADATSRVARSCAGNRSPGASAAPRSGR
jgi:dolichyl-phosphate beta-glucosyltransferase